MSTQDRKGRYIRVLTHGKALPDIEGDILQAVRDGARALMDTAAGLSGLDAGSDSRNGAIAEWAEGLSREHGRGEAAQAIIADQKHAKQFRKSESDTR